MNLSDRMKFLGKRIDRDCDRRGDFYLGGCAEGKNCWHTIEPITKRRIAGQWLTDIKTARDRQKAENAQHVCNLGWNDEGKN